jgi:hypothetical protein
MSADEDLPGRCECGWRAPHHTTPDATRHLWDLHLTAAVAASRRDSAIELGQTLLVRATELRAQRALLAAQRSTMILKRAALMRRMVTVRRESSSNRFVTVYDMRYLDRARSMAEIDLTSLWLQYVTLGGTASFDTLRRSLDGTVLMPALDYNLLAVVINETLAEAGLGRPVDYVATSRFAVPAAAS